MVKAVHTMSLTVPLTTRETVAATDEDDSAHSDSDDEEGATYQQSDSEEEDSVNDVVTVTFHRLPCIAHLIQLAVRVVDKHPSFMNIISKIRCIVHSIHVSSVATQKLIDKCGKTVIADCPTRWSSTLFMVNRLLECKTALTAVFTEQGWDCLQNCEWLKADEISRLFQPFAEHTNTLQTDDLSFSSNVPVVINLAYRVQEIGESEEPDNGISKVLAQCLLQVVKTHFAVFVQPTSPRFDPLPAAACLLDPYLASTLLASEMTTLLVSAKAFVTCHAVTGNLDAQADDTAGTESAHTAAAAGKPSHPTAPPPLNVLSFLPES